MARSLRAHHPTKTEIVDLAALEGHDADIPSNLGSIHNVHSNPSTQPHTPLYEKDVKPSAFERDIEKGASPSSTSIAGEPNEGVEEDPNVIDFDGPDDPQNPMNWKFCKKWGMVLLISAITFLTPLASSMFAPGVPEVMRDFNSTNDMLQGFMVSVYVLGFSFGPLTIGPCIGPVIGGFLTVAKGWRWNFWFVAIVAGAFFAMSLILMSETSAPIILERKTKKLRAETGNEVLRSKFDSGLTTRKLFIFSIVRPAKMLTRSTICFAISLYVAITYTYLYILFTTFTAVFTNQYHWHGGITGLSFLGLGIGSLIGQFVYIHYGNRTVSKHIERGDFKPEQRLHIMCVGGFFLPIGLLIYGWSANYKTHYIVPLIGTGIIGFGLLMTFMPANTYLIDVFTKHAASAMAANTVLRSLMAALVPLSSQKMYAALGLGWGNSLLAFVSLALVPIPFLFIKYGERIRTKSTVKL
ncbi:transmembrane transport [Ascochyta rabiei]|uniref:Transmembrane transport n=1 Tax=Didymella rabiei TaxID=5454 RepID=A0A163CM55_DIDRA|nr:transmembrane transport [Ascochyta rabiei]